MEIILVVLGLVFILGIFLIIKYSKGKKLTSHQKSLILRNYKRVSANKDYKHQIIDFDKLYHKILGELDYKGSFGQILKQNPRVINDINKVWELHKLRNKLVHEFDSLSEDILKRKSNEYDKLIKRLINEVTKK
ncbi:MAG: hypothetical protein QM490_00180 [Candidatus Gracilibacteria bacterium]